MQRKFTSWKKNRKFGDVKGGRKRPKIAGNVFKRYHSLERPLETDTLPILLHENPSSNYFWPISIQEAKTALNHLPYGNRYDITHIWFRRRLPDASKPSFFDFICGRGVRVISLYPWPKEMQITLPEDSSVKDDLANLGAVCLPRSNKQVLVKPTLEQLRLFYTCDLLYLGVGYNEDWYMRHWTGPSGKASASSARAFARSHTQTAKECLLAL